MKTYLVRFSGIIQAETAYFFKTLPQNVRRMILSNSFQAVSGPLVSLFISAFIWKTTHSFIGVAAYNVGRYAFHPVMFFLNGFFLRKVSIKYVFLVGCITAGLSALAVVAFRTTSVGTLFLYGCIYGIGYGLYWANRNYLEFNETVTAERQYFFSLVSVIGGVASILVPLVAGWFIVIGRNSGFYSGYQAYFILFVVSFLLMVVAGMVVLKGSFASPFPKRSSLFGLRRQFFGRRTLFIVYGLMDGISFIPALLILSMIGNEAVLGTVTAVVAVITIVLSYLYGRLFNQDRQYSVIVASCGLFLVCAAFLGFFPGVVSAVVYIVCLSVASTFFSISFDPISLDLANKEMGNDLSLEYAFIVDSETFLNVGRLLMVMASIALSHFLKGAAVAVVPLVAACLQMVALGYFFAVKRSRVPVS